MQGLKNRVRMSLHKDWPVAMFFFDVAFQVKNIQFSSGPYEFMKADFSMSDERNLN